MAKVRFTKVLPPTPDEFRARARQEFAFLAGEFGFREVPIAPGYQNPVAVWFENGTTRVVVEGINWAANARVALGRAGLPEAFENIDLGDLATVRCPGLALTDEQTKAEQEGGQWVQLSRMAKWLRECGAEMLRGDFGAFPEIQKIREGRSQEWRRTHNWSPDA